MKRVLNISLLLMLGILIVFPAMKTLLVSFQTDQGVSFANYEYLFKTPGSLNAISNTLLLGFLTVLICGAVGTFLAFFVHYFDFPFRNILDKVLMLPLVVPGLIIVFAFVQLYGESGLVTKTIENLFSMGGPLYHFSGLGGILFIHACTQYIYFYINVSIAIKQLDRSVIEASVNLGASTWKVFKTIILPYIMPALISSSILTFMTGIGSFSAPSIIGGNFKVLTTQVLLSKATMNLDLAAAQVIVLCFFALSYLAIASYYGKKSSFMSSIKGLPIEHVKIGNPFLKGTMSLTAIIIVLMIVLPIFTIVFLSFVKPGTWMVDIYPRAFNLGNYINLFSNSRVFAPFANSIKMASIAALATIGVAIPASYVLTKTQSRTNPILEFMVMLPFALPASAIAINMINGFSSTLLGTWIFLPLAYFVSLVPLAVRSVRLSYERLQNEFGEASQNLGATRLQTFINITFPLIAPGVWAGFLLVFIRSLGEYTISVLLYTASNKPISIAMVNSMYAFDIGLAMAYGALVLAITFIGTSLIKNLQTFLK